MDLTSTFHAMEERGVGRADHEHPKTQRIIGSWYIFVT